MKRATGHNSLRFSLYNTDLNVTETVWALTTMWHTKKNSKSAQKTRTVCVKICLIQWKHIFRARGEIHAAALNDP
jgi:hypothetical protein